MFVSITKEGLDILYKTYLNKEYPHYFRNFDDFLNLNQFASFFDKSALYEIHEDGKFVGVINTITLIKPRIMMVGLLIFDEFKSNGYAVKAMKELGKYVFSNNILRLVVVCSESDERTMTLMQKAQFDLEARHIKSCFYEDKFHNEIRWVLPVEKYNVLYKEVL